MRHLSNQTRSYSNWQSIPFKSFIGRKVKSGVVVSLPLGSKYEMKLDCTIDGYGAAAKVFINLNDGTTVLPVLQFDIVQHPIGTKQEVLFTIDKQDVIQEITMSQNISDNAGMDFVISYRSTPVLPTLVTQTMIADRHTRIKSHFSVEKELKIYLNSKKECKKIDGSKQEKK